MLVRNGCIGTAPTSPTLAITFRTLNAFRQMHRTCPRFSRQAFVRSVCHIHETPFAASMANGFTIAYDTFLEILYRVQERCNRSLGRDDKFWRMKNACAPCMYVLEDEPPLRFKMLVSIDGNSSLKLVGDEVRAGTFLPDDMWVSREDVDRFKDGVSTSYNVYSTILILCRVTPTLQQRLRPPTVLHQQSKVLHRRSTNTCHNPHRQQGHNHLIAQHRSATPHHRNHQT